MKNKFTFALAGAMLLGFLTAITVFIAMFIGYWLIMITALIGAYAGIKVLKEEDETNKNIPEDWWNDVGTEVPQAQEVKIGKVTKH